MNSSFRIQANRVDVLSGEIAPTEIEIADGHIRRFQPIDHATGFALPGFIDAHVHIESSMVLPSQFAKVAVTHGTVATVSDPHEIANVCGLDGIELMLRDAASSPLKFHFGAPSCVPATQFETAGATLSPSDVEDLLDDPRINHLSEVMNFPGVLRGDLDVMAKIVAAQSRKMPIDGHAPGLLGNDAKRYIQAGITTDHECVDLEEAVHKIECGARIAIREGSAAKNFEALWPLIDRYPRQVMLCSDDKHPDDLLEGHIDQLVARAVAKGCDLFATLRAACVTPQIHYALNVGLLQVGDPADFVIVDNLIDFPVSDVYIDGSQVVRDGSSLIEAAPETSINQFGAQPISDADLCIPDQRTSVRLIEVYDGQLVTGDAQLQPTVRNGYVVSDPKTDVLKLAVVNRYAPAQVALGFARGFGLQFGALASSVAHDSHNIIAIGTNDDDMLNAINQIITSQGGLCVAHANQLDHLPLPIAGLMSDQSCLDVARKYGHLDHLAKQLGCQLNAPFMTLSFLALPVIPQLKLTDQGLFDVGKFQFVSLFAAPPTS